jgi:hypothetical protein
MAMFPVLDMPPLFTLTRAIPESISLTKIFIHWPADQSKVLIDAQSARETLLSQRASAILRILRQRNFLCHSQSLPS